MKLSDINIRDPYVLLHEDKYYLYGTRGETCWGEGDGFDVYVSDDLENWSDAHEVFHNDGSFWANKNYWAPEVHKWNGEFYMFASFKREGVPYTLVFANCEHLSKRQNVVVKASVDDGASFPYRLVLNEEQGGYVEVATDMNRGHIYVLYETNYGESLQLASLEYEDLVN